jgi:hypothetical protein
MSTSLGHVPIQGRSGQIYHFHAYALETPFDRVGAVYFITSRNVSKDGRTAHSRIYCGETEDLSTRASRDAHAASFKQFGANCICVILSEDAEFRRTLEEDIHSNYKLLCTA